MDASLSLLSPGLIVYMAEAGEHVKLIESDGQGTRSLATRFQRLLEIPFAPEVRVVERTHPHFAFRRGFPEFRMVVAMAPNIVVVKGVDGKVPGWIKVLADLGVPLATEKTLAKRFDAGEAAWTRPSLVGPGLERLKAAARITILDPGVAIREGDGVTISTSHLGGFQDPAPDFFIFRSRTAEIPFPDERGSVISAPPEDVYINGGARLPFMLIPQADSGDTFLQRAILRSSTLWPTVGVKGALTLASTTESYRGAEQRYSMPMSMLVVALRKAGITCPIHWRGREDELTEGMSPAKGMELASLEAVYGPFHLDAVPADPEMGGTPLHIRIDPRELDAGFVSAGVADWIARERGTGMEVCDRTWITAPENMTDFVLANGYQPGPAPAGTPEVLLTLPPLYPGV